jgi:hypothetical protein
MCKNLEARRRNYYLQRRVRLRHSTMASGQLLVASRPWPYQTVVFFFVIFFLILLESLGNGLCLLGEGVYNTSIF